MAKTKTAELRITKELQNTLLKNPQIKEVYFGEDGDYFFNKHKIKLHKTNERMQTTSIEDVECLPGAKMTTVFISKVVNGAPEWKPARRNTEYSPVAATFSREDILAATPVPTLRSEKEKLEILSAATEIMKADGYEELLKKLVK